MTSKNAGTDFNLIPILVQFATYAVLGRSRDALMFLRKTYPKLQRAYPQIAEQLQSLLTTNSDVVREYKEPFRAIPVDLDSRYELLKRDEQLLVNPAYRWPENVMLDLTAIVREREQIDKLSSAGLSPTKSVLFTGMPGVGKTVAATWIAQKLKRPLLTLDLASVMSSYLGKTGNNLRAVLDYAKSGEYVLLLDEFDAVAKRRDDSSDIGELKRLVTVLLQAIDEWPEHGILIAATNHPELLDPAIWRRFERVINFPKPSQSDIKYFVTQELRHIDAIIRTEEVEVLSEVMSGMSYSDIDRCIKTSHRSSLISDSKFINELYRSIVTTGKLDKNRKLRLAYKLKETGMSQRAVSSTLGISRTTMKKHHDVDTKGES